MELSQIRIFKAVADHGSVAKASEVLHCVPSNVTARIKALESELGTALFHREGRGIRISPAGEIFLPFARQILVLARQASQAVAPSAEPKGPLRIGAIESSATGRLPPLLASYHARYPDVSLQLSTATWPRLLEDVSRHRLDGAIIAVDVEQPDIERIPFHAEELVLIASASAGTITGPDDLAGKTILMWPEGCPYRAALEKWLRRHGHHFSIVSVASYGTIVGCVSAGAGVALVPKGVVDQYGPASGLCSFTFPELGTMQNYFIWHKDASGHPALDAFISAVSEHKFQVGAPAGKD
jgi:DNA-binding transcriptional LysR family regulator